MPQQAAFPGHPIHAVQSDLPPQLDAQMVLDKKTGCMTILAGDWNCALGQNLGMPSNDSFVSPGGKVVLEEIAYGGWTLINSLTQEDDTSEGQKSPLEYTAHHRGDTDLQKTLKMTIMKTTDQEMHESDNGPTISRRTLEREMKF